MGLTSALNTAVFGITYNQRQIDVTASNVANADTAGYSRKSISAEAYFDGKGNVAGLGATEIRRFIDKQIQSDYFNSLADTNYSKQISAFADRLDDIFGTLGDDTGLSSLASKLTSSLSALVNDPGNYAAQKDVIAYADAFARELNASYRQIADLRQEADDTLGRQTETVNSLLQNIEDVDEAIRHATLSGGSSAELEDQRDRLVEQLSGYLDVSVTKGENNAITIRTNGGQELFSNGKASTLSYVASPTLKSGQPGNSVYVTTPGGTKYDLIDFSNSGAMVAMAQLRDDLLPEAQRQLDTIAAEMSLAFSNVDVASTATTVGLDSGFVLDVSGVQPGNTISLTYTDTLNQTHTVTLVAVDDPSLLPLSNSTTANPNDEVFGFDISSGLPATYITNIQAALAGTGLLVSNDGSDKLQILGDNTGPTSIASLAANVTVTASSDQGLGLAIFVDRRDGTELFTDGLENGGQRVGFASGIAVNPDLLADSTLLVKYQTTPTPNTDNDPARAQYLLDALSKNTSDFDPSSGIGGATSPFKGTVLDFINQVVSFQGNQADDAKTFAESKEALTQNLAIRYEESYAVDIDTELAFLVQLQNAYAANARVMQTLKELFDELLNVV